MENLLATACGAAVDASALLQRPLHPRSVRRALPCLALALAAALPARAAQAVETGTLIQAPGATLYVEVRGPGSGVPLVVANGGPGFPHDYLHSSDAWDVLARRRPVVFYDQRGDGQSPPLAANQSCSLADQISDLDAVRAHIGAEKIDLLGHSWGGYLVMAYAASHPEHIAHLIILDSAAPKWSDTKFLFREVFPEGTERQDRYSFADEMGDRKAQQSSLREYLAMLFYSPEKRDAFLSRFTDIHFNKKVNQTIEADLARFDLNPELRKYGFPTLVGTGRYDMNVAPVVAWNIHRGIPGSKLAVFERSGHLPFYEEPEEFVRVVESFLSGH
ncbi:MAG TPA: alpha/beta fold hydrolase [Thermoanaerobaculia bacterium]|nr:alpha/beta fold hydrolase [Thermoanaerobaculia bacterium]